MAAGDPAIMFILQIAERRNNIGQKGHSSTVKEIFFWESHLCFHLYFFRQILVTGLTLPSNKMGWEMFFKGYFYLTIFRIILLKKMKKKRMIICSLCLRQKKLVLIGILA